MPRRLTGLIIGLLLAAGAAGQTAQEDPRVGRPRWAVMTATDPGAARISGVPVRTTIEALLARPRPAPLPDGPTPAAYRARRFAPVETTLWSVEGEVVEVHHTDDGDFHFLLRGAGGRMMACELPDPARLTRHSPFAARMARARRRLVAALQPGEGGKAVEARMRVVGLGYFGRTNPLENAARSGVQLHPIVDLQLLDGRR